MGANELQQILIYIVFGFGTAFLTTFISALMGFFQMPIKPYDVESKVYSSTVGYTFGLFAAVKFVLAPSLFVLVNYLFFKEGIDTQSFMSSSVLQGWFTVLLSGLLVLAYAFYFYILHPEVRRSIFGKSSHPEKDLILGISSWLLVFPWVFAIQHLVEYITWHFYQGPPVQQVAVDQIKQATNDPLLFWSLAGLVVVVAPVIEEILFRGVLQEWLKQRIGIISSLLFTSILFALMHFADQQGIFNLSIIAALFVLSLFLGFLKERQGSILAPIGLHCTVNGISFFMIILQEKIDETLVTSIACLFIPFW